ncbi:MAG: fatty-acid oxidation protein subunit alpha [Bacteroidetes bacterium]|nr:MAG: fatty-acid oxidation protein subunit alpha [Bacteroidota bacterium]
MARDTLHENVRNALIKDGWQITDDPLTLLTREEGGVATDLGAEKVIFAEQGTAKIAVEVKSFLNPSIIHDFMLASGQYKSYEVIINYKNLQRKIYLAMPIFAYDKIIKFEFIQKIIQDLQINLILFNPEENSILSWKE